MRCPWYLSKAFFWVWIECGRGHRGPMSPYCLGPHELLVLPWCPRAQMVSLPLLETRKSVWIQ
ncbi:unnamed protein product [Staurois parvus]|uniref:Uncharacterized protein n=1 Tax=Staurois parvus TaxID=386267 RepID=A0ABN9GX24_9NEOB|nr:unnamed protein product [Staurois parvus]